MKKERKNPLAEAVLRHAVDVRRNLQNIKFRLGDMCGRVGDNATARSVFRDLLEGRDKEEKHLDLLLRAVRKLEERR